MRCYESQTTPTIPKKTSWKCRSLTLPIAAKRLHFKQSPIIVSGKTRTTRTRTTPALMKNALWRRSGVTLLMIVSAKTRSRTTPTLLKNTSWIIIWSGSTPAPLSLICGVAGLQHPYRGYVEWQDSNTPIVDMEWRYRVNEVELGLGTAPTFPKNASWTPT